MHNIKYLDVPTNPYKTYMQLSIKYAPAVFLLIPSILYQYIIVKERSK